MKKAKSFQTAKIHPQGITQLLFKFQIISVWCCFKSVAYVKKRVQKNDKKQDEYTKNQHWLNSYACCFLVSMKKIKPVLVQENKKSCVNVQRKQCQ